MKNLFVSSFVLLLAVSLSHHASAIELIANGGFETGDFSSWESLPSGADQQSVVTANPSSGTFAAEIFNNAETTNSFIRQANLGAGILTPGESVTITFDARGRYGIGGVAFAELFTLDAGNGVTKSEILGGAPLAINEDPEVWTPFSFTTTVGPDAMGGLSFMLGATNGAVSMETTTMWYDNVSVATESGAVEVDGDYNDDGTVNAIDYTTWRDNLNAAAGTLPNDPNGGAIAAPQYTTWKGNFGTSAAGQLTATQVPEPSAVALAVLAMGAFAICRRR